MGELKLDRMKIYMRAFHGGKFWRAIGQKFDNLKSVDKVISADVLDAWFDPAPDITSAINSSLPFLIKTSPPTDSEGLISAIAQHRGLSEENIIVSNGSSDIIFRLFPHIINDTSKVLLLDPMYGEYAHIFDEITPAYVIRYTLSKENDFNIKEDDFIEKIKSGNPTIVVLVNPNNPTGKYFEQAVLKKVIDIFPEVTFVIDESYIEYIGGSSSLENDVASRSNLIVIKSMSKAYALSGLRVGYAVLPKELANKLSIFIPPWAVSTLAQMAAIIALQSDDYYAEMYRKTHNLRDEMVAAILNSNKNIRIYPSSSNFFLIELLDPDKKATEVIAQLENQRIFLRNCDSMSANFDNKFIRIAIKKREQNSRVALELLKLL